VLVSRRHIVHLTHERYENPSNGKEKAKEKDGSKCCDLHFALLVSLFLNGITRLAERQQVVRVLYKEVSHNRTEHVRRRRHLEGLDDPPESVTFELRDFQKSKHVHMYTSIDPRAAR
jgi:hypothetical protein